MTKYEFLKNYKPKNRHFTSNDEIELIINALDLKGESDEYFSCIRDYVVMTYCDLMKENDDSYVRNSYVTSMMSVTAVIDHYRFTHNMDV